MEKTVINIVMSVECLVRSEFTVPGWTEFTVKLVPVTTKQIRVTVGNAIGFSCVVLVQGIVHLRDKTVVDALFASFGETCTFSG